MVKTMTIDESAKYLRENGIKISKEESMVKTMTIDEAAKYLRENGVKISKETLSNGIQAEKLPFGLCIDTGRSRVFMIFKRLVDKWLEEREI